MPTYLLFSIVLVLSCVHVVLCTESIEAYMQSRAALVQEEVSISVAGNITLNAKEIEANTALQAKEVILMGDNFPPALNFFEAHGWILNTSIVYPIIKQMPKGSALHQHLLSTGDLEFIVYNLTYFYPCYVYAGNGTGSYKVGAIGSFGPAFIPSDGPWIPVSTVRAANPNFDTEFMANLTLQNRDFGDYYQLWSKFQYIFGLLPMLMCKEIMMQYLLSLFAVLQRDNIQHAEFRTDIFDMYDLLNNAYTFPYFLDIPNMFAALAEKSNFSAKIIVAPSRKQPPPVMLQRMEIAYQLTQQYPDTIIGFDMDGPEDEGNPLIYYLPEFLQVINSTQGGLRFYFHAGETFLANNTNLYDAILLNTTRVGHGFQFNKHPILLEDAKTRGICIEVCPISNQILGLVTDLRIHPAYEYFNRGIPMVISSDDPSIYGYEGTSCDFYEVYMAWNLALNSIQYSSWLNAGQEQQILAQFTQAWNEWIDSIINSF